MKRFFTLRQVFCCLLLISTGTGAIAQNLTDESTIKAKILKNISGTGISPAYLKAAHITSNYKEKQTGIEHVYIQQTYQGIDVYNQLISLAFKDDKLLYASGKFINAIEKKAGSSSPSLSAQDAVLKAASHLNLTALIKNLQAKSSSFTTDKKIIFSPAGISKKDIETRLYWTVDSLNKLHLTWNVNIDMINKPDWWNVRVDALSGSIIQKDNWTVYEDAPDHAVGGKTGESITSASDKEAGFMAPPTSVTSAIYNVVPFPAENINVKPFTQVTRPWEAAGAGNNATTYGWQYDGAADYTITRGNNVYAYEDRDSLNKPGVPGISSTPLPNLTFTTQPDLLKQPDNSVNQQAAITNLFYWNNLMHDVMYQYGFDEISGNFQSNNLLRGGKANDYVLAEAQDGLGTNNANFNTPPDGSSGRMQMYLWSNNAPPSVFTVNTPASIAGTYSNIESALSDSNKLVDVGPVNGTIVYYSRTDTLGCNALVSQSDIAKVKGKIVLIYRGTCMFEIKVKNAQNAGAIAAVVANNTAGTFGMGGDDNSIKIPAISISQADGNKIAASIRAGNSVTATLKGNPTTLDGDIDNGIITHEYGHGVSNRLTGGGNNTSCLYNAEEGGEGWSDYQALMMTTDWTKTTLADSAKSRPIGTYVIGQGVNGAGIRRYPYSINMKVDPLTYANMATSTEVHNIGEIWCSVLWDMTWGIIKQESKIEPNLYNASGNGGNAIALQLVLEGMKLQPCSPGFLDARNAILAADSILYGYRHKCTIWNAFARRGMGASAIQGSANSATDQTAAYDVIGVTVLHNINTVITSGQVTQSLTATCGCVLPATSYTLKDTIPAGFTYVSSNGGSIAGSVVSFPLSFSTPLEVKNVSLTLSAPVGCNIDTVVYDDRDAHKTGGFVSSTQYGLGKWDTTASKSYSPSHSWYAPDGDTITQYTLTSGAFIAKGFSLLSFWHYLNTEYGYDGGQVELKVNNTAWRDAAPYFVKNGYNGTIDATADTSTTYAAGGAGYTGEPFRTFSQTLVNLSSFSDSTISVRYRVHSDQLVATDGWYIDDITVANGCGGFQNIGLYNGNKRVDSFKIAVFAVPSVLPVTLVSFTAEAKSASSLLTWQTASEVNMKSYVVEVSKEGTSFITIGSINAKGQSSNSYTLTDANPYNGWNYYRIKMLNADGSFTYSPVRSVLFTNKGLIAVRPNPASSSATVYIDKDLNVSFISLTDMQGKLIKQVNGKNIGSTYTFNTSSLASGTYLVKITPAEGTPVTVKLVVQH